jgi:hypothetical protein
MLARQRFILSSQVFSGMQMKRVANLFIFVALISLMLSSMAVGLEFGRVYGNIGGAWPQGSFNDYADPGFNLTGRIMLDFDSPLSLWGGLGLAVFSRETSTAEPGEYYAGIFPVQQAIDYNSLSFNAGFEFAFHKGVIRPRIAVGPGFYLFFTEIEVTDVSSQDANQTSRFYEDTEGKFGWRAIIGVDVILSPNWGITLDFMNDTIYDLNRPGIVEGDSETSRFIGVSAGVVFTFEAFADKIKDDEWEPQEIPRERDGN